MRPYLALIKDSFRAALASRVLYVLLAVITLLLLVIAPIHVVEILDWKIVNGRNVPKPDQLAIRLVERGEDPKYPAANRVWEMMSENVREEVTEWVAFMEDESTMPDGNKRILHEVNTKNHLAKDLNRIIKDKSFYKKEIWEGRRLFKEAEELIESGPESLTVERSRRLNRLLMANAVGGGLIQRGAGTALDLRYATFKFEDLMFTMSHSEFSSYFTQAITYIFDKFVMSIGLFIAILVTANIIPETFLPGSLNLLLSKPISRWGLLVAKFIGGLAFVSLCACYLFLGVWIWLGICMGIWDPAILWSIPMYIIVFAIYFSVSTLVGVWSRSQILSIVMTILFWAFCFGIGTGHSWVKNRLANKRTNKLVPAGESMLQVGEMNSIYSWNEAEKVWDEKLAMKMMDQQRWVIGGVLGFADPDDEGEGDGPPALGPVSSVDGKFVLAGMVDLSDPGTFNYQNLYLTKTDEIRFKNVGKLPRGTISLFATKNGFVAADSAGKFWLLNDAGKLLESGQAENPEGDGEEEKQADKKSEKKSGGFLSNLLKSENENFTDISPRKKSSVFEGSRVAFNSQTQSITVLSGTDLVRYQLGEKGKYVKDSELDVDELVPFQLSKRLSSAGNTTILALGNGQIITFDEATLEKKKTYRPQKRSRFKTMKSSPDGRFTAFACRDKTVWLLDNEQPEEVTKLSTSGQGSITAIEFNQDGKLWLGYENNDARLIDVAAGSESDSFVSRKGWLSLAYNYCLKPFYWVCPKPGEFYKVVLHIAGSNDDEKESKEDDLERNLSRRAAAQDPYQPLWSGLLFMCATLALACLIFQWRDF